MRDLTLKGMEETTRYLFNRYVEPLAETMMTGEVPSVAINIVPHGTVYTDWLAKVKFRNSTAVSIFHCTIYLDDVMRLCRNCKMYLVTRDVFNVSVLYYMIHPLYQTDWVTDRNIGDYESMMLASNICACRYIREYYPLTPEEDMILAILDSWMMVFTNRTYGKVKNQKEAYDNALDRYVKWMMKTRKDQYITSRRFKAQTALLDCDGFILLEHRITGGDCNEGRKEPAGNPSDEEGEATGE